MLATRTFGLVAARGRGGPMTFLDESIWQGKVSSSGWKQPAGGAVPVTDRATGAELGRAGIASAADIAAATAAAAAAQPAWAATPHTERAALLRRAGDIWNPRSLVRIRTAASPAVPSGRRS